MPNSLLLSELLGRSSRVSKLIAFRAAFRTISLAEKMFALALRIAS